MACTDNSCALPRSRSERRALFTVNPASPEENLNELRNLILSLTQLYNEGHRGVAQLEDRLHDVWDVLVQTSKITPATSPEQDRLVVLVLSTRELGIFHRKDKDGISEEDPKATTLPNGQRLWSDLPYLAQEIQGAWITESSQYTTTERANLAVSTAKLCAVGICETELGLIALWLLKETLEVERPLTEDLKRNADTTKSKDLLSIEELLPACFAWLSYAKFKLVKLAAQVYDPTMSMTTNSDHKIPTEPGNLAAKANVTDCGFSLTRWVFWRLRLKELSRCGNEEISKVAKQSFEEMIHAGVVLGIDVHGEKNYFEKVYEALGAELKAREARGMSGCVDTDDITINMDWAD